MVIVQGLHAQANDEHGIVASEEPPGQSSLGAASVSHGMHMSLASAEDSARPDALPLGDWATTEPWAPPLLPREQRMRRPRSDRGEGRLQALAGMVASDAALAEEAGVQWGVGMPDRAAGQQPGLRTLEHRSTAFLQHLRQYTQALHACVKPTMHISEQEAMSGLHCLTGQLHRSCPA